MPIPASPTILLAVASLVLIAGRYADVRRKWIWPFCFLIVVLLAMYVLSLEPILNSDLADGLQVRRIWKSDGLALCEQWLVLGFGVLTALAVFDSVRPKQDTPGTCGFLLFALAGLMLVAGANDFLSLGLSLEIVQLAVIALRRRADFNGQSGSSDDAPSAGVRGSRTGDAGFGWLTTGWMWLGIAILANATATTHFDALRLVLTDAYDPGVDQTAIGVPSKLILLATGLISMSLFARMGLVPFHLRFCSNMRGQSYWLDGLGMLAGQLAGSIALTRLMGCVFVGLGPSLIVLTMTVSLATFVMSGVQAIRGFSPGIKSVPRWVASLMLLQSGWLAVGLMIAAAELQHPGVRWGAFTFQTETLAAIVYARLANLLACGGVFWILGHLTRAERGVEFLEDFKGLGQFAPTASIALTLALASIVGFPFMAGFWGRWLMLVAGHCVHGKSNSNLFTPHDGLRITMLIGVAATLLVAVFVIRMAREMLLESPLAKPVAIGGRGPLIAGAIAAITILLLGIAPQVALIPLRAIQSPRAVEPATPGRGSGKNSVGSRSGKMVPRSIAPASSQ